MRHIQSQGGGSGTFGRLRVRRIRLRHPVADARLGEDVGRIVGVVSQLAAGGPHGGAYGAHVGVTIRAPNPSQHTLVGQYASPRSPMVRRASGTGCDTASRASLSLMCRPASFNLDSRPAGLVLSQQFVFAALSPTSIGTAGGPVFRPFCTGRMGPGSGLTGAIARTLHKPHNNCSPIA